jgi:hypothetical protein
MYCSMSSHWICDWRMWPSTIQWLGKTVPTRLGMLEVEEKIEKNAKAIQHSSNIEQDTLWKFLDTHSKNIPIRTYALKIYACMSFR